MLLGADLLNGPSDCGWSAIASDFKPDEKATLYKVAHHGSPNADTKKVWRELLSPRPVALIAPYRAGVHPRPDAEDSARICDHTQEAYITASARGRSRTVRAEQADLGPLAENVRELAGAAGQVRARVGKDESEWTVELVPPARRLCEGGVRARRRRRGRAAGGRKG
jgi:hypothetical protein